MDTAVELRAGDVTGTIIEAAAWPVELKCLRDKVNQSANGAQR